MPKVLVVDDSPVEQQLIASLLGSDDNLQMEAVVSGPTALRCIKDSRPDLVVADMEISQVDGLELLKRIRIHYSNIPVIVMTSAGSEAMAIEALDAGAASYVSKSQLEDLLLDTVHQVLSIVEANRNTTALMGCLRESFFEFDIESDPALIEPLVQLVLTNLSGLHMEGETHSVQMGVALEQALLNALYRSNLELTPDQLEAAREDQLRGLDANPVAQRRSQAPYCDRKIHVKVLLTPQTARFVVRDDGPGCLVHDNPRLATDVAPEEQADRGLRLMKTLMDEVVFNERGNEVTLIKHVTNGKQEAGG